VVGHVVFTGVTNYLCNFDTAIENGMSVCMSTQR